MFWFHNVYELFREDSKINLSMYLSLDRYSTHYKIYFEKPEVLIFKSIHFENLNFKESV